MERQMTAVDVQAYLRDVKDRIMDARVIALVEEDLEHGLMPGEINDYTDRGLSFEQMKAVSDMYRNKIPMAVVASIGAKKYDAEKMKVATELYLKQIPVEDIEKALADTNTALDMRMDQRQEKTAKDIINEYSEMELFRTIRDYGEEKFAKNIAKHICRAREEKSIETTFELNEIIKAAIPIRARSAGGHPSKRTFQAIRIELNQELTILEQSIDQMIDLLNPGGRICIITFHSLEDRIVKRIFKNNENPCI